MTTSLASSSIETVYRKDAHAATKESTTLQQQGVLVSEKSILLWFFVLAMQRASHVPQHVYARIVTILLVLDLCLAG